MHEGIRKLKLERFHSISLMRLPPEMVEFDDLGLEKDMTKGPFDCLISAALDLDEMKQLIDWAAEDKLNPDGVLYILYPKKGNRRYEFWINRDDLFSLDVDESGFFGQTDLKLNSMTSFDDVFTVAGIKRIVSRQYKPARVSQSVADYRHRLEELRELLTDQENVVLDSLTPGYQAGWARYVLSAVRAATRQKRLAETKAALAGGFKSIEFYKDHLKTKQSPGTTKTP